MLGREHGQPGLHSRGNFLSDEEISRGERASKEERRRIVKEQLIMDLRSCIDSDTDLEEYQQEFGSEYDQEILDVAREAQAHLLCNKQDADPEDILWRFEKICTTFGFSKEWQENPILVEAVHNQFLVQIQNCVFSSYRLKQTKAVFGDPVIINDPIIREALAVRMLNSQLNLWERAKLLSEWGLPVEPLKKAVLDYVKVDLTSPVGFSRGLDDQTLCKVIQYAGVWPEVLDLPDLMSLVCARIETVTTGELLVGDFKRIWGDFEVLVEKLKLPADFILQWKKDAIKKFLGLTGGLLKIVCFTLKEVLKIILIYQRVNLKKLFNSVY